MEIDHGLVRLLAAALALTPYRPRIRAQRHPFPRASEAAAGGRGAGIRREGEDLL